MRKNQNDRILKGKPKKQHLSTVSKSYSLNKIKEIRGLNRSEF